jgi:hypothetical protein
MNRVALLLWCCTLAGTVAVAQDTLPRFSAIIKPGNRIVISWTNNDKKISQINIQRSTDSIKNFKTIVTVPDPSNPQNGFVDTKAPYGRIFYRLFIVTDKSNYTFTPSQKPSRDTARLIAEEMAKEPPRSNAPVAPYRASRYVYTEKYGNVMIALPDADEKKYSVSFFSDDNKLLFEVKDIRSTSLIVDKTNFVHSGWFWFELFENGALKERQRFFLPRDF